MPSPQRCIRRDGDHLVTPTGSQVGHDWASHRLRRLNSCRPEADDGTRRRSRWPTMPRVTTTLLVLAGATLLGSYAVHGLIGFGDTAFDDAFRGLVPADHLHGVRRSRRCCGPSACARSALPWALLGTGLVLYAVGSIYFNLRFGDDPVAAVPVAGRRAVAGALPARLRRDRAAGPPPLLARPGGRLARRRHRRHRGRRGRRRAALRAGLRRHGRERRRERRAPRLPARRPHLARVHRRRLAPERPAAVVRSGCCSGPASRCWPSATASTSSRRRAVPGRPAACSTCPTPSRPWHSPPPPGRAPRIDARRAPARRRRR